ncbi:hypothetical protein [Prochlorothrix hollandica]|uniref:hypothetical protein n=1 Tax=Prochlorothrix hollandica TaxID=1223 RepID=UPI001CEC22E9
MYVQWIGRFILFHNKRHPSAMGGDEVRICCDRGGHRCPDPTLRDPVLLVPRPRRRHR